MQVKAAKIPRERCVARMSYGYITSRQPAVAGVLACD